METIAKPNTPANRPIPLILRTYKGPFSLFRQIIKAAILEIEKESRSCDEIAPQQ